jgi:phosphate uptake regulator
METRKVQLSGGTTYTVSLPKSWATEQDIEAGSIITLRPNDDGTLLLETTQDRSGTERSVTADVSTASDRAVRQRIRALYAVGYDSVTVVDETGHGAERRQAIERTVDELSGFELLEATNTRIRLTTLIDAENIDVRKITLRLRLMTLAMHRDAITAVTEGDVDLAERVVGRDSEADKLFAMITRHFRRALMDLQEIEKLDQTRDELFEYYYVCRQFERIADHAEKIADFARDPDAPRPEQFTDRLVDLGDETRQVVDDAAAVILGKSSVEAAHNVLAARSAVAEEIESLDRSLYEHDVPDEAYVVGLMLDSLRRTAAYGGNIAGIAIQRSLRE